MCKCGYVAGGGEVAVSSEMEEEEFDWQVDQQVPLDENEVHVYSYILWEMPCIAIRVTYLRVYGIQKLVRLVQGYFDLFLH